MDGFLIDSFHVVKPNLGFLFCSCVFCFYLVPDDFDNFCHRASKLAEESDGAPLFTVAETHSTNPGRQSSALNDHSRLVEDDGDGVVHMPNEEESHEDDWQFL